MWLVFFFFKQKTAYELRISDWSSDVCSSDLVPVSDYTSQKRFEQERAIFRRVWLNVAREEELPQPGDWIVREIACLSASILICRERTGQLRAFHNICLHRGMR